MASWVKRVLLVYTDDSLEDHYDVLSTNGSMSLVWHRKNRVAAISRSSRLCDLRSIHHISHSNIATIYSIFLHEKESYVAYEHLEVDIMNLPFTTEVELASALSQLLDGVRHLTTNGVLLPADSFRVSMSGRLKIVLNICFLPCGGLTADHDYWTAVCAETMDSLRLPIMSYRALEFLSILRRGELPSPSHYFLDQSQGPQGISGLVAQAFKVQQDKILPHTPRDRIPYSLHQRLMNSNTSTEGLSLYQSGEFSGDDNSTSASLTEAPMPDV